MSALLTLRNGLIALAAALAAALGFETEWGAALTASPAPTRSVTGKHDNAAVLPDFRLSSEANNYAQISERPLLNPTRKPAPTQLVVAATEPPKPQVRRGLYLLMGVTDLGSTKIAQVREVASNRVQSVREGEQLQEMTVKKVDTTQVTLAFQGETDVLELPKFTASGRVPQPVAPAPQLAAPTATVPTQPAPVVPVAAGTPTPSATEQASNVARMLEMRRAARAAGVPDPTDPAVIEERRRAFQAAREGRQQQ